MSGLRPRQAFEAPAVVRVAMVVFVEVAFESVRNIIDIMQTGFFQRLSRFRRAAPGTADEHDGAIDAGGLAHMRNEHRVDLPVRAVHPGDMDGAARMADKHVLHLAAHVDEYRFGGGLQKIVGLFWGEMLHGCSPY